MKIGIICLLTVLAVLLTTTAYAQEPNFEASLLTAENVNCKKCHPDTPHNIHAQKPVDCVACHGNKLSVSIPQCTKCHDGPIHKVHEGKVNTQSCDFCHKTITDFHNALSSDAVCGHCHGQLIEVHGEALSCEKCHKSPPEIVKPVKLEGTVLVCENCHQSDSVATIHGDINDKTGCYSCHSGTTGAAGSQAVHTIHGTRVGCQDCHGADQEVFIPQCPECHRIDDLHAFDKIGKLTSQTGLQCPVCHSEISRQEEPETPETAEVKGPETLSHTGEPQETMQVAATIEQPEEMPGTEAETPGFSAVLAAGILVAVYMIRKCSRKSRGK